MKETKAEREFRKTVRKTEHQRKTQQARKTQSHKSKAENETIRKTQISPLAMDNQSDKPRKTKFQFGKKIISYSILFEKIKRNYFRFYNYLNIYYFINILLYLIIL